jgi:hypothetical protein
MTELAPPCFCLLPQQGDDLGARMAAVFTKLCHMGHRNIVLIGGDLPPVPLRYFAEAYAFLATSARRVVLGPSRDGGYYLVGCNQPTPQIFQSMSWSHSQVLHRRWINSPACKSTITFCRSGSTSIRPMTCAIWNLFWTPCSKNFGRRARKKDAQYFAAAAALVSETKPCKSKRILMLC